MILRLSNVVRVKNDSASVLWRVLVFRGLRSRINLPREKKKVELCTSKISQSIVRRRFNYSPWHVFQSSSSMKPSGHRQNTRPIVDRHVWEHPALLTLHGPVCLSRSHVWLSAASDASCKPSQEHSYPPTRFRQVSWQGPWPLFSKHSLTSTQQTGRGFNPPLTAICLTQRSN